MPWRYHGKVTSTDSAQGQCDRCGFYYSLKSLLFQHQWRGSSLQNTWFRVCSKCMDVPSEFLKAIVIPADPVPVQYPRVPDVQAQMNNQQIQQWDPPPTYTSINPPTQAVTVGMWDDSESNWDEG